MLWIKETNSVLGGDNSGGVNLLKIMLNQPANRVSGLPIVKPRHKNH